MAAIEIKYDSGWYVLHGGRPVLADFHDLEAAQKAAAEAFPNERILDWACVSKQHYRARVEPLKLTK